MANITGVEQQEVKDEVLRQLAERHSSGALKSEMDFIAGAVTVMSFLMKGKESNDISWAPAIQWIFAGIGGRSIVADYYEAQGQKKRAELVQKATIQRARQWQSRDKLSAFPRTIREILRTAGTYRGVLLLPTETVEWIQHECVDLLEDLGYYEEED